MTDPHPRSRRKFFFLLFILLLGGGLVWAFLPRPASVEVAGVERGPYEQQVTEEGKTRAKDIFKIFSPVTGNLQRVQRHPGDPLKKGDLLATVLWPQPWEVHSPVAGSVLKVIRESDGPINRGEIIMEVADPHALEIVSEILTEDALSIKPGDPVRIESAGECPPLQGTVRVVEPTAFTKVSALGIEEQRVNVIIDIASPVSQCERLADGFRVYNHITTFRTEQVLTVPVGALFRVGKDWAVFRVEGGKARKAPVEIARRNPERAIVTSGLKEGDEVLVYPGDQIEEGTRVRPYQKKRGD